MTFDMLEANSLDNVVSGFKEKMQTMHKNFDSSVKPENNAYSNVSEYVDRNVAHWIGREVPNAESLRPTVLESAKQMYNGTELSDGTTSLGLKEISKWKKNPDYYDQNVKQQSGFSAEVIGTTKENIAATSDGSGIRTYRADDRPDLYKKNDQYVDKIRVNESTGEVIEKIQVKFVGKDAESCYKKLTSKGFDKYFDDGQVDKMEIPNDYYDGVKEINAQKLVKLEDQLQKVTEKGDIEAIQKKEYQIERCKKIDNMLEKSTVTSDEAIEATKHPERYTAKLFAADTFAESHKAGMDSAAVAVTITAAVSTVDNVSKVFDGEITAQEAFVDVAKDTAAAGGIAYATAFVSTAASQAMSASSHQLIKSLGNAGVPAAVISVGVQSYDSVVDYATGVIDGKQLAYDLGENVSQVAGGMVGSAIAGAAVGSIVPGAGTAVGFAAGMVGGMIGCAVASEAYASAVEFGAEHADELLDKAKEMATKTVDIAKEVVPDAVGGLVSSINDFAITNKLPFRL